MILKTVSLMKSLPDGIIMIMKLEDLPVSFSTLFTILSEIHTK